MEGISEIISQLERQREAIERAIQALREVESSTRSASVRRAKSTAASAAHATGEPGKRVLSASARHRMALAQKRRWAAVRKKKAMEQAAAKKRAPAVVKKTAA